MFEKTVEAPKLDFLLKKKNQNQPTNQEKQRLDKYLMEVKEVKWVQIGKRECTRLFETPCIYVTSY